MKLQVINKGYTFIPIIECCSFSVYYVVYIYTCCYHMALFACQKVWSLLF